MSEDKSKHAGGRPSIYTPELGKEIYALRCPLTDEIRYIGKANNGKKRLASHLKDSRRRNTPLYSSLKKLSATRPPPNQSKNLSSKAIAGVGFKTRMADRAAKREDALLRGKTP